MEKNYSINYVIYIKHTHFLLEQEAGNDELNKIVREINKTQIKYNSMK